MQEGLLGLAGLHRFGEGVLDLDYGSGRVWFRLGASRRGRCP